MIFLITGKAGSGKDFIGEKLKEQLTEPTAIIHYADYLKWLYTHYFNWNGVKDEKFRTDIQTIGTDIVRNTYDEDFWVKRVIEQIQIFNGQFSHFIIPDARFENEIQKIEEAFGSDQVITIRVERPDYVSKLTEEQQAHPSETALDNYLADLTFVNDENKTEEVIGYLKLIAESVNAQS